LGHRLPYFSVFCAFVGVAENAVLSLEKREETMGGSDPRDTVFYSVKRLEQAGAGTQ
jgi:hypothetical protein